MSYRITTRRARLLTRAGKVSGTLIDCVAPARGLIAWARFIDDGGEVTEMQSDGSWPEGSDPESEPLNGCFKVYV